MRAIRPLAEHDHQSPDCMTEEERRADVRYLKPGQHASRRASTLALCGLKFFYAHTGPRAWTTLPVVRPPREKTLPGIRSMTAVRTLLAHRTLLRSRGCLTTIYACGRRLQEGTHLQIPAIDRARLRIHVRGGNGATDRSVPRPPPTLAWRRQDWNTHRHPGWLFRAPGRGGVARPTATAPLPRSRVQDAFRAARTASGLPKRASVHPLRHSDATPWLAAGVTLRLIQEDVGHHPPTTTAIDTPRTLQADAIARQALHRRMTDLERPWEISHDGAGGPLPARWTGVSRQLQRPPPPAPRSGHGGH